MRPLEFIKALSDETRLKIVKILSSGEFTVMEITRILAMGQSRVSRHLKILTDAGITEFRRDGTWIYYSMGIGNGESGTIIRSLLEWMNQESGTDQLAKRISSILEQRRQRTLQFFSREAADSLHLQRQHIHQSTYISEIRKFARHRGCIADLGCGSGETIAQIVDLTDRLIGVDNSSEMLLSAERRLSADSDSKIDFRLGNLEHLPLRDGEADGVIASMVIHHIAQPSVVFSEMARVLNPNGSVLILDFSKHSDETFRTELADIWLGFTKEHLRGWLSDAGFKNIEIDILEGEENYKSLIKATANKR